MKNLANTLGRKVVMAKGYQSNLSGSVTDYGTLIDNIPSLTSIVYTLDNTLGGGPTQYMIGDPTNIIVKSLPDGVMGLINVPSKVEGNANLVDTNKNMFLASTLLIEGFSIETSSDASQFANSLILYTANATGQLHPRMISLQEAQRNTQFQNKLLTVKAEFKLGANQGLWIKVIDGEVVTLTLYPKAYTVG